MCRHLQIGVSHTTRQMIDGEQDGVTYHYVSQSEFINLINTGEMLTHKNFLGCYYGLGTLCFSKITLLTRYVNFSEKRIM